MTEITPPRQKRRGRRANIWKPVARVCFSEGWDAERVLKELQAASRATSPGAVEDLPSHERPPSSVRQIERWKAEFDAAPPEEQREYLQLRWPESFGVSLPWDAAPAALELLAALWPDRPTVGRARWFWRVSQAIPDAELRWRDEAARSLHARELLGQVSSFEELEAWMSFAPWRSSDAMERYSQAFTEGTVTRTVIGPDGLRGWDANTGPIWVASGTDATEGLKALDPRIPDALIRAIQDAFEGRVGEVRHHDDQS